MRANLYLEQLCAQTTEIIEQTCENTEHEGEIAASIPEEEDTNADAEQLARAQRAMESEIALIEKYDKAVEEGRPEEEQLMILELCQNARTATETLEEAYASLGQSSPFRLQSNHSSED